jgi:hypothetical protein
VQCEQALGPDDGETLLTIEGLAISRHDRGDFREAIRLHRQALDGQVRVLGPDHGLTLETMINLADSLRLSEQRDEARELYERASIAAERIFGTQHPTPLSARRGLALLPAKK